MPDDTFGQLCQRYLEQRWYHDPVGASGMGIHTHDSEWPDLSQEGLQARERSTSTMLHDLNDLPIGSLKTADDRIDYQLIRLELEARLRDSQLRLWERAPYQYPEIAGRGLHSLLERDYAPLPERVRALVRRMQGIPALLDVGKANTSEEAPPLWVDIAIASSLGLDKFLQGAVPEMSEQVPEKALALQEAAIAASEANAEFRQFLEELAPRARGSYAVGKTYFDALLRDKFLLDLDSDQLHEFGLWSIENSLEKLTEVASRIVAGKDWAEVMDLVKEDHCQPDELLTAYQKEIERCRDFVQEKELVTIPPGERCDMAPTPVFLLSRFPMGHFSMVRPFEQANQGYWFMTPVDTEQPWEKQKQHLRDNNYHFMRAITLHECYPGHHLQGYYSKLHRSDIRKSSFDTIYGEGWGLYTEEMMYEAGFLNDPRDRLVQLRNELWRGVRIVIDTGLHTANMGFEEATQLLMDKVRFERLWAEGEIRRYTTSPTQPSSYLVGRNVLLNLRNDYQQERCDAFRLKEFHDRLLSLGSIPLALVRQELLGEQTQAPRLRY